MKTRKELQIASRSKRTYPERKCFNSSCEFEKEFTPHDRRQKFCCNQCRVNYHNDARHTINNNELLNEKRLRGFDKKLKKIYQNCVDAKGVCTVSKEILAYEQIDLRLSVSEQANPKTGGKVKWFYTFGTEIHPNDSNYFLIYKKTSK